MREEEEEEEERVVVQAASAGEATPPASHQPYSAATITFSTCDSRKAQILQ